MTDYENFLTDGRRKRFLSLSQEEQTVQLEETYGSATMAITRARSLCLIMGPLDMKELTVMGNSHVWSSLESSCQLLFA